MLIKPNTDDDDFSVAAQVLSSVTPQVEVKAVKGDRHAIRDIFSKAGAGIEDAARRISTMMHDGDSDTVCLRASELAMKVQGFLDEMDDKVPPVININITGDDSRTILNLVGPISR